MTARAALRVALALAAATPLARAALGPLYGGDIALSLATLPASLEPAEAEDAAHRLALGLVHETLLTLDDAGRLGPGLARAELRAASGREWRLELQPGARFHDDAVLTSDDALRALRRFLEADVGAALRDALEPEGVSAPDAGHVVLRFRDPPPQEAQGLASPAAAITSPGGAGAGPFVPTLRIAQQRIALTAFSGHMRGRPFLDRVTLVAQPDPARRAADVAGGRADAALDATPALPLAPMRHGTLVLVLDPSRPPCDDAALRDALAAAAASADVASFVPGALAASRPVVHVSRLPPDSLRLVVAADVPAAASRRLSAVLESLGARVSLAVLSPRDARREPAPVRLLLDPPAARSTENAVALARLPIRVAARPGLHGLRLAVDGRLVLEAAWVEP